MPLIIRLGSPVDIDAAVAVFEQSNFARRGGIWPNRSARVERVIANLRDPATWFLMAADGPERLAMAAVKPLRSDDGAGTIIVDGCFLAYLYVIPERWGQGIGGTLLEAVLSEARRRGHAQVRLWTHEDNERSHRLYRSHGFAPTGQIRDGEGEWARQL